MTHDLLKSLLEELGAKVTFARGIAQPVHRLDDALRLPLHVASEVRVDDLLPLHGLPERRQVEDVALDEPRATGRVVIPGAPPRTLDLAALRDPDEEDPKETAAKEFDLSLALGLLKAYADADPEVRKAWEIEQEQNLIYVALTRA